MENSQPTPAPDPGATPPAPPDQPIDDAQLSPRAWLARNGPVLLLCVAALIGIYYKLGLEGLWTIAKVAIGLSAVVFIHELGHFAVAKWCDVHVQTFSIGFGPALPGCSYKWGETTYKLALFPLGGYVKMVGEGGENDEEDADPRSFKNKTVGQRMAIISAGVVMNVIFGLVAFIVAFKIGVPQIAPGIGVIEGGSPAWQKGVRTGDVILKVDDTARPSFEDVKMEVMLSSDGEKILFVLQAPGGPERAVSIVPRKTSDEPNPVIGVRWPMELKLPEKRDLVDAQSGPVLRNSPAAAARALDLKPDDRLVKASSPDDPDTLTPLPEGPEGYAEFAGRLSRLDGKPVKVSVRRKGTDKEEVLTLGPDSGFHFEDSIVGTTDPENNEPYNPFKTGPLKDDPRDPQGHHPDYFAFLRRMNELSGKAAVLQVRRKGAPESEVVNLFVPPAYHRVIPGVRMKVGAVTAVREGSSAEARGVKAQDDLKGITLTDAKGESVRFVTSPPKPDERPLDPLRLPFELRRWAAGRDGVTAAVHVTRKDPVNHDAEKPEDLAGLKWDASWRYDEEVPLGVNAAQTIPELGIAYQVKAQVADVAPESEAAAQGLRADDFILAWSYQRPPRKPGQGEEWIDKPKNLRPDDASTGDPAPRWAGVFYQMQSLDYPRVKLLIRHPGTDEQEKEIELELRRDESWPLHDPAVPRGVPLFGREERITRADGMGEAVQMGFRYTWRTIVQIYMSLKSLLTGRVKATENLQGPIDIAVFAYSQANRDWGGFILLLGLISVNLAVVNFLPIPVLDGGHMVFLVYEKLRGRPAREPVRAAATWFGLLVLLSLMGFVIYLGFTRWIWPLIKGS